MKNEEDHNAGNTSFPVVAIGAAEGGKEALAALLAHLPTNAGMAYIYIQHPGTEEENGLAEWLSGSTKMAVATAKEGMAVSPDQLYILPHTAPLTLAGNLFTAAGEAAGIKSALPINRFFVSLAENSRDIAIGIILSGIEIDGAIGLKAIKMAGGITFVQNETARFQSMPRSAAAEGAADFILPPQQIAEELAKLSAQKKVFIHAIQEIAEEATDNRDENLTGVLHLLYRSTGVDFSQYKTNTIRRRIVRRMMLFRLQTLEEYATYIRQHAQEINLLYNDLLINVTSFFRDAEGLAYLKDQILPRIIKSKGANDPLRIWVPACSTGQEAYSVAMLLLEVLGEKAATTPVQIFATDLSESAITKARLGVYSKDEVTDVDTRRLQLFFNKIDGHYRIIKGIRDLCIFATHNMAKDPPFSRLDLISCCNLLIYLDTHLQKKVMATFHYSLVSNGYLILGKSETVGNSAYLFSQIEKKYRIYIKKKDTTVKAVFEMNYRFPEGDPAVAARKKLLPQKKAPDETDLEEAVDRMLLKRFTPASVLVNSDLDILHFRGSTGLYLEPLPGKASLNLLKMARPGLGFELRNIVHKAKKSAKAVKRSGLQLTIDGKSHSVTIEALPLKSDAEEDYFLVVFEAAAPPVESNAADRGSNHREKQLEGELTALREDMRSIVEAQEAANEELQSANEEIVSSNEELQSINEELETSKEEIESSNEELITMNQELQMRNEQLAESQEYSEAVFGTIRESLVILDKDLRIKTANSAFYKTFHLGEGETEGRLLYDLNDRQWNIPKLRELLGEVLSDHTRFQGYEIRHFFPGIGEKVLLLNVRMVPQKIHGQQVILLAIEDITAHKEGERITAQREAWFRSLADNAPAMIWVADANGFCTFINQSFYDFRGISKEAAIGKPWSQHAHPDDEGLCAKIFEESFAAKKPFEITYRLLHNDGTYRIVIDKAKPNFTSAENFSGYIGSCIEVPSKIEQLW